jgi:hypothetical protein
VEAHELGPRLEGCNTGYRITIHRNRTESEGRHQVEAHKLGPRLEGCDTDYRITIETEQRVKVVVRWRHTSWDPGSRDATQIIE